jgi:hypothetical protein
VDDEENFEEGDEPTDAGEDKRGSGTDRLFGEFTEQFGWLHSAVKVRETTGYTIDQVFNLNVVEFLNYLVYIRSWGNVQAAINKEAEKRLRLRR